MTSEHGQVEFLRKTTGWSPASTYRHPPGTVTYYSGPYGEFPVPGQPAPKPSDADPGDEQPDPVSRPSHYRRGGFELIDVLEAWDLHRDGRLMQAAQYLFRARHKGRPVEDVRKAVWYLERWLDSRAKEDAHGYSPD